VTAPGVGGRLRVAFLSHHFGEYSVRLASALARIADVQLLLPRALFEPFAGLADPALTVEPFDRPRLRQPVAQLRSARELAERIRAFRPDVLHVQQGHLWANLALPFLRSIPLVVTVHDARHHPGDAESARTPQWVMDAGFRLASDLIVHAGTVEATVRERIGRSGDDVHLVPHIAIGGREDAPHRDEDPAMVLFFGRIWPYKGLEYLVRAEPLVTAAVPQVRFVVAGRGEDLDRYVRMMVHPERFEVRNAFISEDDRVELFQRAAVVVLPYLEASQSGVVPVAYAFAKPVVATTVGGLPEAVDDGVTGLLVPPADEAALAAAIVRLLRDPDLRHRMGAAGLRKLEAESGPDVVAAQTLAVYERAIARRGRSR
jgi:glycosyltransferase involved in cell wall biosynthesis